MGTIQAIMNVILYIYIYTTPRDSEGGHSAVILYTAPRDPEGGGYRRLRVQVLLVLASYSHYTQTVETIQGCKSQKVHSLVIYVSSSSKGTSQRCVIY